MDESRSASRDTRGFTLVEVLVAVVLLMVVALGAARLFAIATTANFRAKNQTSTSILAIHKKMEQLRGLEWGYDTDALPVSDTITDLSRPQPTGGGNGLNPSPADSLARNAPGYFDLRDAFR